MKNQKLENMNSELMCAIKENAELLGVRVPGFLWYNVEQCQNARNRFFVAFDQKNVEILPIPSAKSSVFFRIIYERRHRKGGVWFVHYNRKGQVLFNKVGHENWDVVRKFIEPKRAVERDDREMFARKTSAEKMFMDAYSDDRYHKPGRKGFQRTYAANNEQRYLSCVYMPRA